MAEPRGLYVHIPFCSVKCFYCDFTAFAGQRASVGRHLRALELEAASRRREVHTLYVGGGTPSELSAEELSELFRVLAEAYGPIQSLREITVEANPESLGLDKIDALARAGVNRLSLGLQTLEPRLLRVVGRRHTVDEFLSVYREARRRDFAVSVDLMYALPTQTLVECLASLDAVLELAPDHISLYGLQVEDRTLFGKREIEIDEDLAREMFEASLDRLAAAGYKHYEISNFARPGRESIHNRIYWRNGEYVGLGCGASGYLDGARYTNLDRLTAYCEALERGGSPIAERESLGGRARLGETVLLGLRMLGGIELTPEIEAAFPAELRHVQDQRWAEAAREASGARPRLRLTREGVFLANRVFEEFVPPFRTPEGAKAPAFLG